MNKVPLLVKKPTDEKKNNLNLKERFLDDDFNKENKVFTNENDDFYHNADLLSQLSFSWINRALELEKTRTLKSEDLGTINKENSSAYFSSELSKIWNEKKYCEYKKYPFAKTIFRFYIGKLVILSLLSLILFGLSLLEINLLQALIMYFDKSTEELDDLIKISLVLITSKLISTFTMKQTEIFTGNLCMKSVLTINCFIFNKILRASPSSNTARSSQGEIVNYLQIDSPKLIDIVINIPQIVLYPIQIVIFMTMLFNIFGVAFIFGTIPLFSLFGWNYYMLKKMAVLAKGLLQIKDNRMKKTIETFEALKILKMYDWDDLYMRRIIDSRDKEIEISKNLLIYNSVGTLIQSAVPVLTNIITIGIYQYMNPNLDFGKIIIGMYVFGLLQGPVTGLPNCYLAILGALVSSNRIEKFIKEQEIKTENMISGENPNIAIKMNNLSFTWGKTIGKPPVPVANKNAPTSKIPPAKAPVVEEEPIEIILKNISFEIKKGEFVGLIGEVGSGKSSLLQAIMNNLLMQNEDKTKKNTVEVNGSMAFTQQTPWIQNETLKNNILFFEQYDEKKYKNTLEVAQLNEDIKILPGKDLTEIGEKGINLSGGQKSRVDLARAIYADRDIYLFDDPISALDADVGKKVFTECFMQHLKNKTRILATHNIQWLYFFDRIIWINSGEIIFDGKMPELEKQIFYKVFTNNMNIRRRASVTVTRRASVINSLLPQNLQMILDVQKIQEEYNNSGNKNNNLNDNKNNDNLNNSENDIKIITRKDKDSDNKAGDSNIANNHLENENEVVKTQIQILNNNIDEFKPLKPNFISKKRNSFIIENVFKDFEQDGVMKSKKLQDLLANSDKDKNNNKEFNKIDSRLQIQNTKNLNSGNNTSLEKLDIPKNQIMNNSKKNEKEGKIFRTTDDEDQEIGEVKLTVFMEYYRYMGGTILFVTITASMLVWQGMKVYSDIYLAEWTKLRNQNPIQKWTSFGTFAFFALGSCIFIFLRFVLLSRGNIRLMGLLHLDMLRGLINASINLFHDKTPKGQIYNRLSQDLQSVCSSIYSFGSILISIFGGLGAIFVCMIYEKLLFIPMPVIAYLGYTLYQNYVKTSRCLKRLLGVTNSPLLSISIEAVSGASSIRAFNCEQYYRDKFYTKVDENMKVQIFSNGLSCWFGLQIDLLGIAFMASLLFFLIAFRDRFDAQAVGLLISYSMRLQGELFNLFRCFAGIEVNMVSMERCMKYSYLPQEKPKETERDESLKDAIDYEKKELNLQKSKMVDMNSQQISANGNATTASVNELAIEMKDKNKIIWPSKGVIEFVNYSVQYRPETPLVLFNLSFRINPGEKVGIVGRTGSGKSTICNSLFRILEPFEGTIFIDGEDITQLGLKKLRRNMTIIPQDPCIFRNTLRFNLDPLRHFTDQQIIDVLKMIGFNLAPGPKGIYKIIGNQGENLSVGEKQLICIARAILRKSKIVVMDEATANIDFQTEESIQKALHIVLKDSTIITIAHRIKTILSYDKILVLEKGKIVEFDTPQNLLSNPETFFYKLNKSSNSDY